MAADPTGGTCAVVGCESSAAGPRRGDRPQLVHTVNEFARFAAVSRVGDARRLQQAIVDLGRITTSRRLGASRAERAKVDISPAAAAVLRHVVLEGPIRPVALSERTPDASRRRCPASSRRLEADGLIERVATPERRPRRRAAADPHGAGPCSDRLEQADDEILAEQLAGWSAGDLAALADLLERFVVDLRSPADHAHPGAPAPSRRPTTRRPR